MDIGSAVSRRSGISAEKIAALPGYRSSALFSETGKLLRVARARGKARAGVGSRAKGQRSKGVLRHAGGVPCLRRLTILCTTYPALARWANVCRAYGAYKTDHYKRRHAKAGGTLPELRKP